MVVSPGKEEAWNYLLRHWLQSPSPHYYCNKFLSAAILSSNQAQTSNTFYRLNNSFPSLVQLCQ